MGEIRKDYVLERSVIVSQKTKKIPVNKKCPYCPGNESMTNPSISFSCCKRWNATKTTGQRG